MVASGYGSPGKSGSISDAYVKGGPVGGGGAIPGSLQALQERLANKVYLSGPVQTAAKTLSLAHAINRHTAASRSAQASAVHYWRDRASYFNQRNKLYREVVRDESNKSRPNPQTIKSANSAAKASLQSQVAHLREATRVSKMDYRSFREYVLNARRNGIQTPRFEKVGTTKMRGR